MSIKNLLFQKEHNADKIVQVKGWLLTKRIQKEITFIKINDGSCPQGLQLVIINRLYPNLDCYTIGCSLEAHGKMVETMKSKARNPTDVAEYEMECTELKIIGLSDKDTYPFAKTKLPLEYLRKFAHIRGRTSTYGSIFRLRSAIMLNLHKYLGSTEDFLFLNPPIITKGDCEGGGGVFQVTEKDLSNNLTKFNWKDDQTSAIDENLIKLTNASHSQFDHFNQPVYLTVSSQLQLEALACSLGRVYTTNKSFRAEHSSTHKHLSEFEHLEIEACFITLDELMDIAEKLIKTIACKLLDENMDDILNLEKFVSPMLSTKLREISKSNYMRIRYTDAISLLQTMKLDTPVVYGMDLNSEMETALTNHFNSPVFVFNWTLDIKAFYMKRDEVDSSLCNNFDLLMPYKVGELIGGSMREDSYDKLLEVVEQRKMNIEPIEYYLNLRKHGSVPHGGFGLGLDRLIMLMTGMENIRDVVPFPIQYKSCDY